MLNDIEKKMFTTKYWLEFYNRAKEMPPRRGFVPCPVCLLPKFLPNGLRKAVSLKRAFCLHCREAYYQTKIFKVFSMLNDIEKKMFTTKYWLEFYNRAKEISPRRGFVPCPVCLLPKFQPDGLRKAVSLKRAFCLHCREAYYQTKTFKVFSMLKDVEKKCSARNTGLSFIIVQKKYRPAGALFNALYSCYQNFSPKGL